MNPKKASQTETNATQEPSLVSINAFWTGIEPGSIPECTSKDAEPYFPKSEAHAQRPAACLKCGLAQYCLAKSIDMGELRFGIWGGAVPHERRELAKLSGEERRLAIAAFVATIKKNPVKAIPDILPGRDPVPVIKEKSKKSKKVKTVDTTSTMDTQESKQPEVDNDPQTMPFVTPSNVAAPKPKPTQKPTGLRSRKSTQIVHKGVIEADEGTDVFYQHAKTILGIDGMYLDETMDTRDWIDVLRAVATQKEPAAQVAKRYYITEGTVRRQIRNMSTALKKCSPEMRNQLLGIDAA